MKIAMFYHSLCSDWNHGNAHFLRGTVSELMIRGHEVIVYEPKDGWSRKNLIKDHGIQPFEEFKKYYPNLSSRSYEFSDLDLIKEFANIDLVVVHEWNEPELVSKVGRVKDELGFRLLFHDTHHRAVSEPENISKFDLTHYDGVLAFGEVIKDIYLQKGWAKQAWTWHEAADTNVFKPIETNDKEGDLVWIGNWGDNERTEELMEFLINPVKELKLKAKVYGVRYPKKAINALADAGIAYGGWLPNYKVPEIFSKYKVTVHVPRRPYVKLLPGIPTIRPLEALACGIPLVCAPWYDAEKLFTEGKVYLTAGNKDEMKEKLFQILNDEKFAKELSSRGLDVIQKKHTCAHRVNQFESICLDLGLNIEVRRPQFQQV